MKLIDGIAIIVSGVFLVLIVCSGCGDGEHMKELRKEAAKQREIQRSDAIPFVIPVAATNVIDHGNGWHEFELDGNKYLGRYEHFTHYGVQCVTQIK